MKRFICRLLGLATVALGAGGTAVWAAGDKEAGARVYARVCAACHLLAPEWHMTGPSLSGVWKREAGAVKSFTRYSPALRSSGIVWEEASLDAWLADPKGFLPGTWMTFPGLEDSKARADVIAFIEAASAGGTVSGMASGAAVDPGLQDLKALDPRQRVVSIRHCGDSYYVTTTAGLLPPFWESNLRFKTDSGRTGPLKGRPAILPAGMLGDRASVIFADAAEISDFVERRC